MYDSLIHTNTHPTGSELYAARRWAMLTKQQAADLCGCHRSTYERQEAGKNGRKTY